MILYKNKQYQVLHILIHVGTCAQIFLIHFLSQFLSHLDDIGLYSCYNCSTSCCPALIVHFPEYTIMKTLSSNNNNTRGGKASLTFGLLCANISALKDHKNSELDRVNNDNFFKICMASQFFWAGFRAEK